MLPYSSTSSTNAPTAPHTAVASTASSSLSYSKLPTPNWPRYADASCSPFSSPCCFYKDRPNLESFHFVLFSCSISTSSAPLSPATNSLTRPTPPPSSLSSLSTFPPPLFATPMPPPVAVSSSASTSTPVPHPFAAESLFQSSKGKSASS